MKPQSTPRESLYLETGIVDISTQLEINRIRIQDFLNPIQGINAYFLEYDQSILKLNISNLQRLPIEILGLELQNGYKIFLKNNKQQINSPLSLSNDVSPQ